MRVFHSIMLRGRPELSAFSQEYTEYAGGMRGPLYAFKNVDYDFIRGR